MLRPAFALGVLLAAAGAAASVTWVVMRYAETKKERDGSNTHDRGEKPPSLPPPLDQPCLDAPAALAFLAPPFDVPVALDAPSTTPREAASAPVRARARVYTRKPRSTRSPARPATPTGVDGADRPPLPAPRAADVRPAPTVALDATPPEAALATPEPSISGTDAPSRVASAADEEAALLLRALRKLRGEGDVRGGAALLATLRKLFPRGAVAEEVLGLSIEAAALPGDRSGLALAESYLARYPDGRYRELAERARALFRR